MGAAYKDACFDDAALAAASMCSTEYPRTDNDSAGNLRAFTCAVVDGSTLAIGASTPATAASSSTFVPVAFTSCDPYQRPAMLGDIFVDGLAAIVAVAFLKAVYDRWTLNL